MQLSRGIFVSFLGGQMFQDAYDTSVSYEMKHPVLEVFQRLVKFATQI